MPVEIDGAVSAQKLPAATTVVVVGGGIHPVSVGREIASPLRFSQ